MNHDIYWQTIVAAGSMSSLSDKELLAVRSNSEDAFYAITKGLVTIGDLTSFALSADGYGHEEASENLESIANLLRVLPRMAEAFHENVGNADSVYKARKGGQHV